MTLAKSGDFIVLLFGRIIQIGITLLSLRLSTTLLPQVELGYVYYIVAVQSFFSLFLISPVGQYFNRNTSKWYVKNTLYCFYKKQLLYILIITILSMFLLSILKIFGIDILPLELIFASSLLILAQSCNQTVVPMLNMLEKHKVFVFYNLLTAFLCLVSSYIFIVVFSASSLSWLGGIIFGNGLIAVIATIYFRAQNALSIDSIEGVNFKEIRRFCLPIAIATVFMWYLNSGYRISIEKLYGVEYLAFLGVGLAISSQIFTVAESLVTQLLIPRLFKDAEVSNKEQRKAIVNKYFSIVIPFYVSLAVFLTFFVEFLFPFIVAEKYYGAYQVAVYGAWVELGRVLTNTLAIISQIEKKTTKFIFPYAFGAAFLFVGISLSNYFIVSDINLEILAVSSLIVLLIMSLLMKSYLTFKIPFKVGLISVFFTLPSIAYLLIVDIEASLSLVNFFICFVGGVIYLFGVLLTRRLGNLSIEKNK